MSDDDVRKNSEKYNLEEHYLKVGTCSHHSYIPVSEERIEIRRLSTDNIGSKIFLDDQKSMIQIHNVNDYQPGKCIACMIKTGI